VKSLSCGSTKKTCNAEPVFASYDAAGAQRPMQSADVGILFLDEADVAAALDPTLPYFGDIVVAQTQAHVLLDIVC